MESSLFRDIKSQDATVPKYVKLKANKSPIQKEKLAGDGNSEAAVRRIRGKEARAKAQRVKNDPRVSRTIFIGNIPSSCTRKDIKKLVKDNGSVESIRLRSIKVKEGERPIRVAKKTHKQLVGDSSFNAYVVFSSVDEAESCLTLNGTVLCGRHLRIDCIKKKETFEQNQRSVFVGNLPFGVDEEKLREVFSSCGDIEAVRVVRDSRTGVGKGFGYVLFEDKAGVMFAVRQTKKLEIDGRKLRVSRCRSRHQQGSLSGAAVAKRVVLKGKKCQQSEIVHDNKSSSYRCKSSQNEKQKKLVATKYHGKRRPDGTKNRLYRLPATTTSL